MSDLTIPRPVALYASKQFKRNGKGALRTICYHCGHTIDVKPKDGITLRRINHLKECEEFTYDPPKVKQAKNTVDLPDDRQLQKPDTNDENVELDDATRDAVLDMLKYRDEDFPTEDEIDPPDEGECGDTSRLALSALGM